MRSLRLNVSVLSLHLCVKTTLKKIFGPKRFATSHWRVERQFTKKTNRKYHITSMKMHISFQRHFAHTCLLISLACQILVPRPARSQTWTQTSLPAGDWEVVASSPDGSKLAAAIAGGVQYNTGPVYLSTNSGATWNITSLPIHSWSDITCSADGTKLVALAQLSGSSVDSLFYVSTNAGGTWTTPSAPANCFTVASSADGSKLVTVGAYTSSGNIYTSTNFGFAWKQTSAPAKAWEAVCSSADGTKLAATIYNGGIFVSTNSGATWTQTTAPTKYYQDIACSADGSKLVAAAGQTTTPAVYTSTNSGATWRASMPAGSFAWCASSADGATFAVADWYGGGIYLTTDSGLTWSQPSQPTLYWGGLVLSADGAQLVATTGPVSLTDEGNADGSVYIMQTTPTPSLSIAPAATNAVISWLVPSLNFTLQQNSDLTTTNWINVTTPPVLNLTNLQNQVIVSTPASGQAFYRLMHSSPVVNQTLF
jgi:hypothetical protein